MESFQQAAAVVLVLALLGGTLYWLRTRGMATINLSGLARNRGRRMQSLERLPLTAQHSLHLIRVGEKTMVVAVSPNGCTVLDGSPSIATFETGAQA